MTEPKTAEEIQAMIDEAIAVAKAPLDAKNRELLAELKEARKSATITPEQLAKVESDRDAALERATKAEKAAKDATTAAEKAAKALEGEQSATRKLLVDNGLRELLVANNVTSPVQQKAAMAILRELNPEVVQDGESRAVKFGDKLAPDFVKDWAASDEGKHFVAAPHNGGGGAPGGSGGHGGKTMPTSQFNALPPKARAEAMASGVTLTDA